MASSGTMVRYLWANPQKLYQAYDKGYKLVSAYKVSPSFQAKEPIKYVSHENLSHFNVKPNERGEYIREDGRILVIKELENG